MRDDPYERAAASATDSGPSSLGAAMDATAAVAHAAALAGPQGYTCDLCKVTTHNPCGIEPERHLHVCRYPSCACLFMLSYL